MTVTGGAQTFFRCLPQSLAHAQRADKSGVAPWLAAAVQSFAPAHWALILVPALLAWELVDLKESAESRAYGGMCGRVTIYAIFQAGS
jgi:hypothetical protein